MDKFVKKICNQFINWLEPHMLKLNHKGHVHAVDDKIFVGLYFGKKPQNSYRPTDEEIIAKFNQARASLRF